MANRLDPNTFQVPYAYVKLLQGEEITRDEFHFLVLSAYRDQFPAGDSMAELQRFLRRQEAGR